MDEPRTRHGLLAALERATAVYAAMTPEQRKAHDEAQRASFVRGMTARCEHGMADFEQCPDCRGWR